MPGCRCASAHCPPRRRGVSPGHHRAKRHHADLGHRRHSGVLGQCGWGVDFLGNGSFDLTDREAISPRGRPARTRSPRADKRRPSSAGRRSAHQEAGAVVVLLEQGPGGVLEPKERIEVVAFEVEGVGFAGQHPVLVGPDERPLLGRVGLVGVRELVDDLENDRAAGVWTLTLLGSFSGVKKDRRDCPSHR